ncbi:CU044_5270 family protein [Streptomyces sp. NBC_00038]|uniref:CU044_5270 family protein n=1 Tax=Streptomyces sp. NBC_00038 TaxID=2903615 RepID=UPI00224DD506|nr:CU044_5270 family protein [Streptomyces sp. NBC_00038]MCX5559779.1 CU044_5270 family protein [Streptomyces sp. NBC_00038]
MNQLPEKDLPPGRHRLLKEHLMTEIRREEREDQAPARSGNKWLRPAIAAAAVAVVAATAIVALPAGESTPTTSKEAVALLENVALAAEHEDALGAIRDDQWVYVDAKVSYSQSGEGMKTKIPPLHRFESWDSVDGSRAGLYRETGRGQWAGEPAPKPGERGYEVSTNYRHLSTLPTDADEMYDWLRETAPKYSGQETGQAMFVLVGDLIRQAIVPPEVSAALYRAVAKIPGVMVIDNAVDAAGRPGIAIARNDPDNPSRDEWIFDKKTHEFLGERAVATSDWSGGVEKGDVTSNTAILDRAVVDKAGQRP